MENDEKCLSLNAGGSQRGPAGDSGSCGSQLSHNLRLFPNARESPSRGKRKEERCPGVGATPRAKNARKKEEKKEEGGSNLVLARAINTRITISTTNVSFRDSLFVFSTLFFYPHSHDAYILSRYAVLSLSSQYYIY